MIADGVEIYFTKAKHKQNKPTRSTPALNTMRNTEVGNSSSSEDEQESLETGAVAAAAQPSREMQLKEKDLPSRWPNPQECVEHIINNPLRHASELEKIELKHKTKFKEWGFLLQTTGNHSIQGMILLQYTYVIQRLTFHCFKYRAVLNLMLQDQHADFTSVRDIALHSPTVLLNFHNTLSSIDYITKILFLRIHFH